MELLEISLIALAMSIDAFSVALGVGCGGAKCRTGIKMAIFFGFFQFLMPLLGAFAGSFLGRFFGGMNYVAALIIFVIAIKMFHDARTKTIECDINDPTAGFGILFLSLATSMDAFGVGISISLMEMHVVLAAGIIGIVCAVMTWIGFASSKFFMRWFSKAEYVGAAVLFIIGIKMIFS
jgi:putative Mn2+ efflux pump MntP